MMWSDWLTFDILPVLLLVLVLLIPAAFVWAMRRNKATLAAIARQTEAVELQIANSKRMAEALERIAAVQEARQAGSGKKG